MAFLREHFEFDNNFPCLIFETDARQIQMHSHDCLEINFILDGNGFYVMNENTFPIEEGDIFIINNEGHHMAVHDGNLNMAVIVFDPRFIWENDYEHEYLNPFFSSNSYFKNRITKSFHEYPEYKRLLAYIFREYKIKHPGWQLIIKASLMLFLGLLNRKCRENISENTPIVNRPYDRLLPVIEYIHEHFREKLTLTELSEIASMNSSYLSSYFSSVMKMTLMNYIVHVRINEAARLLKLTDKPITETALSCGFNSISYFNRCFTKIMKKTPNIYRKSNASIQR